MCLGCGDIAGLAIGQQLIVKNVINVNLINYLKYALNMPNILKYDVMLNNDKVCKNTQNKFKI